MYLLALFCYTDDPPTSTTVTTNPVDSASTPITGLCPTDEGISTYKFTVDFTDQDCFKFVKDVSVLQHRLMINATFRISASLLAVLSAYLEASHTQADQALSDVNNIIATQYILEVGGV